MTHNHFEYALVIARDVERRPALLWCARCGAFCKISSDYQLWPWELPIDAQANEVSPSCKSTRCMPELGVHSIDCVLKH